MFEMRLVGLFRKEPFNALTKQGPPRPLNPAPGAWPLDPAQQKTLLGRENNFRLLRWEERKIEGFWPKESRENPRGGKSELSPRDSSQAFPGCFASGLAAFSGRARSITASSLAASFKRQREIVVSSHPVISAGERSRRIILLVRDEPRTAACGGCSVRGEINRKGAISP